MYTLYFIFERILKHVSKTILKVSISVFWYICYIISDGITRNDNDEAFRKFGKPIPSTVA